MARIRTVKPEFWDDDKVGELTRDARILFLATFNMADDEGLLRWTSAYLKAQAFMYDDDLTVGDVERLMREIVDGGFILPYLAGGKSRQPLAWIVNFPRHQKVNRPQPSKLTPPSIHQPVVVDTYVRRDKFSCYLCGGDLFTSDYTDRLDGEWLCLNAALDHVTLRRDGGTDHPTNIRAAHFGCSHARGHGPIEAFTPPQDVLNALRVADSVSQAVNDSVRDAVSHSVNDSRQRVSDTPTTDTDGENRSVNDAGNDSPPEGKGRVRGKEEQLSCVADATTDADESSARAKRARVDAKFDEFWAVWPRKIAKPDAKKKFAAAVTNKRADPDKIVEAAKAHAEQWRREHKEKQFIPHPATWLNQGRYDDEVERAGLRVVSDSQSPWAVTDMPESPWAQGWR